MFLRVGSLNALEALTELRVRYFPDTHPTMTHVAWAAIFGGHKGIITKNGVQLEVRLMGEKKLRHIRTSTHLFIEQNPHKTGEWAKHAQEGARIMWVIELPSKYVARVYNGTLVVL
jgi:hypothetical protein